jgi:hypothetical protein
MRSRKKARRWSVEREWKPLNKTLEAEVVPWYGEGAEANYCLWWSPVLVPVSVSGPVSANPPNFSSRFADQRYLSSWLDWQLACVWRKSH